MILLAGAGPVPPDVAGATLSQLAAMVERNASLGKPGEAENRRLAPAVSARLAQADARPTAEEAMVFAGHMSSALSAEAKKRCLAPLTAMYLEDKKSAHGLAGAYVVKIAGVLRQLGAANRGGEWCLMWMDSSPSYRQESSHVLVSLLDHLSTTGEAGKAARRSVAEVLMMDFLHAPEFASEITLPKWEQIARQVAGDLSEAERTTFAMRFRECCEPNMTGPKPPQTYSLFQYLGALNYLGHLPLDRQLTRVITNGTSFQRWSLNDQQRAATYLAKMGPAAKPAREALAAHLGKVLEDPKRARAQSPAIWAGIAAALGEELSPEARTRWAGALTKAHAPVGTIVSAKQMYELQQAAAAIQGVKPMGATALVLSGELWRQVDGTGLVGMARALASAKVPESAEARHAFAQFLVDTHLKNDSPSRAVSAQQWTELAGALGGALADADRQAWAQALRRRALHEAARTDVPALGELPLYVKALRSLGDGSAGEPTATAMRTRAWQAWPLASKAWLAENLGSGATEKPLRAALAARMLEEVKSAELKAAELLPDGALRVASALERDWTDADRAAASARLRERFVTDRQTLAQLSFDQLDGLTAALVKLRDATPKDVTLAFVGATRAWEAWPGSNLTWLAGMLRGEDAAFLAARRELARVIQTRYIEPDKGIAAISMSDWRSLLTTLAGDLDPTDREKWYGRLAMTSAGLAGRTTQDVRALRDQVATLSAAQGDTAGTCARIVLDGQSWESWSARDVGWLLQQLSGIDAQVKTARLKVWQHIQQRHLADADAIRQVPLLTWNGWAKGLAEDLDVAEKQRWAESLWAVYGEPATLKALRVEEVKSLATSAFEFLDRGVAVRLVQQWVLSQDSLAKHDPIVLARIGRVLEHGHGPNNESAIQRIDAAVDSANGTGAPSGTSGAWRAGSRWDVLAAGVLAAALAAPGAEASEAEGNWRNAMSMALTHHRRNDVAGAHAWARRMAQWSVGNAALQARCDFEALREIAAILVDVGLINPTAAQSSEDMSPLALALVSGARRGVLAPAVRGHYWAWGYLTAGPQSRRILMDAAADSTSEGRLELALVLAWSWAFSGERASCLAWLDQQVSRSEAQPEVHVTWLLARGWAESIHPPHQTLKRARPWIDRALAITTNPALKQLAMGWVIDSHVQEHDYVAALAYLDEAQARGDASIQSFIDRQRQDVRRANARYWLDQHGS